MGRCKIFAIFSTMWKINSCFISGSYVSTCMGEIGGHPRIGVFLSTLGQIMPA
jgi:hypothetical protein